MTVFFVSPCMSTLVGMRLDQWLY